MSSSLLQPLFCRLVVASSCPSPVEAARFLEDDDITHILRVLVQLQRLRVAEGVRFCARGNGKRYADWRGYISCEIGGESERLLH